MKDRRRAVDVLPILGSEDATGYLIGVPNQADSEAPQTEKPLIPLRIKGLEEWWLGRNRKVRVEQASMRLLRSYKFFGVRARVRRQKNNGNGGGSMFTRDFDGGLVSIKIKLFITEQG